MKSIIKCLVVLLNMSFIPTFGIGIPNNTDFIVAKNGSGNFTTVQEAINAVPDNSAKRTLIYIKNGIYEEPVNISASKKKCGFIW